MQPSIGKPDLDQYLPRTPLMSAAQTASAMGYPSTDALAKARLAGRLPIEMFQVAGRRGWFASTATVRTWLEQTIPTSIRPREESAS